LENGTPETPEKYTFTRGKIHEDRHSIEETPENKNVNLIRENACDLTEEKTLTQNQERMLLKRMKNHKRFDYSTADFYLGIF
jgi:hypothetical protein